MLSVAKMGVSDSHATKILCSWENLCRNLCFIILLLWNNEELCIVSYRPLFFYIYIYVSASVPTLGSVEIMLSRVILFCYYS